MRKEQITDKEGICLIMVFIMGSSLILGIGGNTKNDAWIAGIVGMIFAFPAFFLYARIVSLSGGKSLFEVVYLLFGKYIGAFVSILYIWYAFHLGALVIRNFGEFVNTVAIPRTPMFVPMLCLGLIAAVAVRLGVEVMARICAYLLPLLLAIITAVQFLAIPQFHWRFLEPVLGEGIKPVLSGGFSAFSFPFAETILFTGVFFSLKTKKSPYKVYFLGLLFAGTIIVLLTIRNILVLGEIMGSLYFPSHMAVSRVSVGEFLQRIEVTVAFVFVVGAMVKISVCLLVASKGVAHLFRLKDYRFITLQMGILMILLAQIIYSNIMDMQYWAFKVYPYYAFPFQVIFPVAIWVFAEMRKKKLMQKGRQTT